LFYALLKMPADNLANIAASGFPSLLLTDQLHRHARRICCADSLLEGKSRGLYVPVKNLDDSRESGSR
jgi:hypothetical protein